MISNLLLMLGIGLVIFSYLLVFLEYLKFNKKEIDNFSGFDAAKEVTANYEEINIVNSKDVIFSEFDINRNVIRLNNKNYDNGGYYDVAVSSILAGYSLVNSDNSNYFKFKSVIRKIGYFSIVSLAGGVLSYFINLAGDAKLGLVLFIILLVYQYMRYQINIEAVSKIEENLDKDIYEKISSIVQVIVNFNKISFIAMLVFIVRLVVIIMGM